jgi:hypothetical protein
MLKSGKKIRTFNDKKNKYSLPLSEKKILNETKKLIFYLFGLSPIRVICSVTGFFSR